LVGEYFFSTVPDAQLFGTATPALTSTTLKQYALVKPFARDWRFPDDLDPRVEFVLLPYDKSFLFQNWMARTKVPRLWK
jgi:hypothetical protein